MHPPVIGDIGVAAAAAFPAIEAPTAERASSEYWDRRAPSWGQIAAPLRPTRGDVSAIVDIAHDWAAHRGPPRIVLFGVTPELAEAPWPRGAQLLAVDYSMGMIRQVWPRQATAIVCGDWRDLPLREGSVDLVVGDGCFAMTRYPDDYARIGAAIRRALSSTGICAMRFFVRPPEHERPRQVLDDLEAGRIGNFHVLKWRLAMALQQSSEEGVSLGDVWQFWQAQDVDPVDLGARMGWTPDTVRSIETYRGSTTRFAFPTLDEIRAALAPALAPSVIRFPAYEMGARLALPAPADPDWLTNVGRLLPVLQQWWGYPIIPPRAEPGAASGAEPGVENRAALCFSGGVDSFHSLLRGGAPVDDLLFVHGFDIPLGDVVRAAAAEASFREVAREYGARAIVVRTNLRQHPVFAAASWEHAHGGALAAVGHLLSGQIGRLLVSSSYPFMNDRPWGSHWRTDPLWSSGRLAVAHLGASLWRDEKVWAIADEPMVRQHLRVCWENAARMGNCSRCDKCVMTMLMLEVCGELAGSAAFEPHAALGPLVDGVRRTVWVKHYERLLAAGLDRDIARSVRGLLRRSARPTTSLAVALRRRLLGTRDAR